MRPGQQNKRGRGRGNNNNNNGGGGNNNNNNFNRKGGNPLTRTYDSSGPDVKIRGTAQHIAEKYAQLARDAQSSGDRVMAENYLQHAEHYNRIIMAAQSQMGPQHNQHQGEGPNGGYRQQRWNPEGPDDEGGDFDSGERGGGDFRAGGGRDDRRYGGNGREAGREQNGSDQPEAVAPDDTATDPVT